MIRTSALLLCLAFASPVAAQVQGTCTDGSLWWGASGAAGLGPCESPEEGFFRFTCTPDGTRLSVASPYPIALDQRGTVDLTVDSRLWRLEGRGTDMPATGIIGLAAIDVPAEVLTALAKGATARLDMPTESRPFHLTGSQAALAAMADDC